MWNHIVRYNFVLNVTMKDTKYASMMCELEPMVIVAVLNIPLS